MFTPKFEMRFFDITSKDNCPWDSISLFQVGANGNISNLKRVCSNISEIYFFEQDDDGYLEIGFVFYTDNVVEGTGLNTLTIPATK